jgi:hypothetical protein
MARGLRQGPRERDLVAQEVAQAVLRAALLPGNVSEHIDDTTILAYAACAVPLGRAPPAQARHGVVRIFKLLEAATPQASKRFVNSGTGAHIGLIHLLTVCWPYG